MSEHISMKKIIFFVFSSILVFTATLCVRLGGFKAVHIEISEYPELNLAYKEHIGPYHKIAQVITEVEAWAQTQHLPCAQTFGEYIDDPRVSDERRLRSNGGCLIDKASSRSLDLNTSNIKIKTVPAKKYILARFTGAPSIGPLKVYPKVEDYMLKHNLKRTGSVFEIYTIKSNSESTTEYLFSFELL